MKTRIANRRAVALTLAVGALSIGVMTGCSASASVGTDDSNTYSQSDFEATLTADLVKTYGEGVTAACPATADLSAGSVFNCVATSPEGDTVDVVITATGADAKVKWEVTVPSEAPVDEAPADEAPVDEASADAS